MPGLITKILGTTVAPVALPVMRSFWPSDKYLWPLALMHGKSRPDANKDVSLRTVHGVKMLLRMGGYPDCAMYHGVFELRTAKLLQELLRPGDTVVDLGGNIGWFSLISAALVGPSGHVHAFEPLPDNIKRFRANIAENGFKNITVHEMGAGDADGQFEIYSFDSGDGDRHMLASLRPVMEGGKKIACQVRTIDKELRDVPTCKVIKLDIEGAEVMAIRGGAEFIRTRKPHIIIEVNGETLKAFNEKPVALFDAIMALEPGYKPYAIDGFSRRELSRSDVEAQTKIHYLNVWFKSPKG